MESLEVDDEFIEVAFQIFGNGIDTWSNKWCWDNGVSKGRKP